MRMRTLLTIALAVAAAPGCAWACSVPGIAGPEELVRHAGLIVRARAAGYIDKDDVDTRGRPLIRFDVLEVLQGPATEQLRIRGRLSPTDDYNDATPPYTFVRPDGRGGDCFASMYRDDAQFLLFLNGDSSGYTPYWAPLAAVNEQLRSDHDPWLIWVRAAIAKRSTSAAGKN